MVWGGDVDTPILRLSLTYILLLHGNTLVRPIMIIIIVMFI